MNEGVRTVFSDIDFAFYRSVNLRRSKPEHEIKYLLNLEALNPTRGAGALSDKLSSRDLMVNWTFLLFEEDASSDHSVLAPCYFDVSSSKSEVN